MWDILTRQLGWTLPNINRNKKGERNFTMFIYFFNIKNRKIKERL